MIHIKFVNGRFTTVFPMGKPGKGLTWEQRPSCSYTNWSVVGDGETGGLNYATTKEDKQ